MERKRIKANAEPEEILEHINSFKLQDIDDFSRFELRMIMWLHSDWKIASQAAQRLGKYHFASRSLPQYVHPKRILKLLRLYRDVHGEDGLWDVLQVSVDKQIHEQSIHIFQKPILIGKSILWNVKLNKKFYGNYYEKLPVDEKVSVMEGLMDLSNALQRKIIAEYSDSETIIEILVQRSLYDTGLESYVDIIEDQTVLETIAMSSEVTFGRETAIRKLKDQAKLCALALHGLPESSRFHAILGLNRKGLEFVIEKSTSVYVQGFALAKLVKLGNAKAERLQSFVEQHWKERLPNRELNEGLFLRLYLTKVINHGNSLDYLTRRLFHHLTVMDMQQLAALSRLIGNTRASAYLTKLIQDVNKDTSNV